jgi:hypothetical protein
MKKEIKFYPINHKLELGGTPPVPAKTVLPEWYKEIPPYIDKAKKLSYPMNFTTHNTTIKRCVPFLDALSSGYMFTLDDDVFVEHINNEPNMRWKTDAEMITWHTVNQFPGLPIPDEYFYMVAKWHNEWMIQTPKGYSAVFSHPMNRIDLPFYTLSGIVDTDKHPVPVQFPFILKKNFEGIIKAGTPLAHITLVKREEWKSQVMPFNEDEEYKKRRGYYRTFAESYKKNFWTPKSHE